MEKLIHFRALLDKLTEGEYDVFWQQISSLISKKELLCTILFHHLTELHSKNQYDHVQNINNILLEILNKRDKQKIEQNNDTISNILSIHEKGLESINISIHDIPNELISEIISYSSFKTYLTLQKVNRRMFIISKTPIKFVKLPSILYDAEESEYCFESYLSKYLENAPSIHPMTNYFNFRTIKSLHIDLNYLEYINDRNTLNKFNNVEYLSIDCSGTKRTYTMIRPYSIHCLKKNNTIKHLRLTNNIDVEIHPMLFYELIPYFPHLESLEINEWDQKNDINIDRWSDEDIAELFPYLEALILTMDGSLIADRIIKVIGHKLKHFAIGYHCKGYSEKGWGNLTELMLYSAANNAVSNIVKTARNIRKIRMNDSLINAQFIELVQKQKQLMYLHIWICLFNESIISLISSLDVSPLKIRLDIRLDRNKEIDSDLYKYIENMAVALKTVTKNNFMLIVDFDEIFCENLKLLSFEKCSVRLDEISGKNHFMIKSNEYKMFGGYYEHWMINESY